MTKQQKPPRFNRRFFILALALFICVVFFLLVLPAWVGIFNWTLVKLQYKMVGKINKIVLFVIAPIIIIVIAAYGLPVRFLEWLHGR